MKIVLINPILYTCETSYIKKVKSIKDSMIYNLCLEFQMQGHEPVLIAASDYKPELEESYPFEVRFLETRYHKIFKPNCFPYMKKLKKIILEEYSNVDLIISSEVFSMNSLCVSNNFKKKTIIWHELAKHNNILRKIPSKIWYNIIAKIFFRNTRIIARSNQAREFISKYCNNVSNEYIDHGVDIDKFILSTNKNNNFIVVSQLIKRKHIDGIIKAFSEYIEQYSNDKLIIIGTGDQKENLEKLVNSLKLQNHVKFLGQQDHEAIIPILSTSLALLINTEKDNSMLSIVESIATGTPIVTTDVPFNSVYIKENKLGLVTKNICKDDLLEIRKNNKKYVENCVNYREKVSNRYHVKQFIDEYKKMKKG